MSKNYDCPYWNYSRFNSDHWSDEECSSDLRFYNTDFYKFFKVSNFPEILINYNWSKSDGMEAFSIFLKLFSYPCRFSDLDSLFEWPAPELRWCKMPSQITIISIIWYTILISPGIDLHCLQEHSWKIHENGAPIENCFGNIDRTVKLICRPALYQIILYNGHKCVHSIKFQFPSWPIRRKEQQYYASPFWFTRIVTTTCGNTKWRTCFLYGHPAYPLWVHLQGPFRGSLKDTVMQII